MAGHPFEVNRRKTPQARSPVNPTTPLLVTPTSEGITRSCGEVPEAPIDHLPSCDLPLGFNRGVRDHRVPATHNAYGPHSSAEDGQARAQDGGPAHAAFGVSREGPGDRHENWTERKGETAGKAGRGPSGCEQMTRGLLHGDGHVRAGEETEPDADHGQSPAEVDGVPASRQRRDQA